MKYTDLLIVMFLTGVLGISITSGLKNFTEMKKAAEKMRFSYEAEYFIRESFCKTCSGNGFASLVEWQKVCKAMWKLEYIGWSYGEAFMEVPCSDKGTLVYGKWLGKDIEGEVYCRK